ncbi:GntR family transcriptional regulator [Eubacterium aggregans]|uniref:GntR family transcriptional regulator n=1 Tax=Eubacterium aggregans TaxID=81409 RepID=UPI001FA7A4FA|nr:GntR family transcriptional regulator [Eubacterium aggregans]MDD4692274.1 GntR family transcriptional regulator [Eubacterium aggregans]
MQVKETTLLQIQAYDYLIDSIKKGELEPGHIYSLNQMAKKMGLSKTPLRDAVLRLEQERYIDILPSKGFRLHTMTQEDIVETYQIRNAIEAYCLRELCHNMDTPGGKACVDKLQRKIDLQREIVENTGSSEDFARRDYEFHRSMVQFVGNATMLEMYRSFMYRIFWLNVTSFSKEGRMADTVTEHLHMMSMIRNQDIIGLEEQLDHHLNIAKHINLELLSK